MAGVLSYDPDGDTRVCLFETGVRSRGSGGDRRVAFF